MTMDSTSVDRPLPPTRGKVAVVGQGYVGLPVAIRAAETGWTVVGYDTAADRIRRLRTGQSYVSDISDEVLQSALCSGRYLATTELSDCEGFDVAVITVPTPLRDRLPDLSFIETSARELAPLVRRGATVVLESTTYPGTTEELLAPLLSAGSGLIAGLDFHIGYSPERIDPGNPTWGFRNTPKVVSGIDGSSLAAVQEFYATLVDQTVAVSRPAVGELVKLLENTFRHVNIALVNELGMFAADLGVDVWEAIAAAATKPFGFMPFQPGPGVGGHCLPVDPSFLSWRAEQMAGRPFRFIDLANDVNDHMPDYVVRRVTLNLNRVCKAVNGARVLVLGLTYKRGSSDARESPAPVICRQLLALGADLHAVEPYLRILDEGAPIDLVDLSLAEIEKADLVLIATDHDVFDWELVAAASDRIFDTRHRMAAGPNVEYL
jgi:UDP-N-acetyl-D-glucosamine dehydrogenase